MKSTLPNGLVLLHKEGDRVPIVALELVLRAGTLAEQDEEAGLAQLVARMLLEGTLRRTAAQLAEQIESVGGVLNAHATEDYAHVTCVVMKEHLDLALATLRDVVLFSNFPEAQLKKEREAALADLASRNDNIFNVAYDLLNEKLYGSHPYGRPLEGRKETLQAIRRDDLVRWHATHVHADGTVFSVAGPLGKDEWRRKVEKFFGDWNKSPGSGPGLLDKGLTPAPKPLTRDFYSTERKHFEQAYLMLGTHAPPLLDPDYLALKLLTTLLGGGMSSRLFQTLREENGLAYEVAAFYPSHITTSQFVIYAGLDSSNVDKAHAMIQKILQDFLASPPPEKELGEAKRLLRGNYLMEHQTHRRQAWYPAWWELLGRGHSYDAQYLQELDAVTPMQIHQAARRVLQKPWVTVRVLPK